MKFDVVTGNPPYQEEIENTSAAQLYPLFMDLSQSVSDFACLITPARFLMNAGKTSKEWNNKMLNNPHLRILKYFQKASDVFSGQNFTGGVVITLNDKTTLVEPIKFFYPYEELPIIVKKVKNKNFVSIQEIFFPQTKWNLDKLYEKVPEAKSKIGSNGKEKRLTSSIFEDLKEFPIFFKNISSIDDPIIIYGKGGSKMYVAKEYLDSDNNIQGYKAIISAADGASGNIGETSARITGKPFVGSNNSGYNQTFIGFGNFSTEKEAESLVKYLKTQFVRLLVGTRKATNGTKFEVWSNVPLQDFTTKSDIDWTKSIPEIDQQLYKKYGLDQSEIEFIESKVKEME
ncbi:Eco57I restriction-modification methylase domain-containing protein [Moraxella sp. PS-22]|uniref:Eco57I restriction-modification methylase domain-containing protein n=1 Tax=Moraxella tetraodonis TaxID=2767221 RepID=A0A9X1UTL3_9GAMM|nr:Eco57I restriction-modification methylase domain-containing protein [Moraxella tetraodonis]MCG8148777.1 Eco57I restriction-modification methylase domain-containing protein [Moraxella tetraodonis]